MTERSTFYSSVPLPTASKCIRVLDVHSKKARAESIKGSLRVINLEDAPCFTSLSYVWGASKPHTVISCDGLDVEVTPNCLAALQHLQKKLGQFTIWIDAICINQDDVDEKSRQIPLMGDIYSQSSTVYIWLGEGNDSSDRAMRYLGSAGLVGYFDGTKQRPFAAAWSAYTARYSLLRHPFPFSSRWITQVLALLVSCPNPDSRFFCMAAPTTSVLVDKTKTICDLRYL